MSSRKVPVNWTIDKEIWEAILKRVQELSALSGIKISVSAVANQILRQGLEKQNGKEN